MPLGQIFAKNTTDKAEFLYEIRLSDQQKSFKPSIPNIKKNL